MTGIVFAGTLGLLGPALTNAAILPATVKRGTGIDGMGFASIILTVVDYLKGNNAYVSTHDTISAHSES